ncbi:endonuclease/exonuclease/phosphatase family protein [Alysiella filiformis]|uniref:Metal-dependent hydrolase, endonuclease/exonuclease/phosphatase family n=1 Tax=Alysiella filiformis DSM 16848 TaxID=1120981 RepID=A0A286EDR1_9NEIS|nr:endonuclease/exonuclease/phosphatase family protein [Alysiella filiformis]QMT31697.1 endonuclease/exonuclease/phosphatase family protein [Alysiella filiformis]UBQ55294.1 endonuclease/exonuclease/phosphatase family protein [Alysiella filiformis DSM 16848]SOD69040.1 Metal-dependent hydrolase, endonuclease/exonuclease/phosphatase family [Alysiella filiformis DSM 16848]
MKILSYNIQAAIAADSYLSYITRLHRQFYPCPSKAQTLRHIADYISAFDMVCLQEIDLGGYRNGFQNQVEQFLAQTPFCHYICQTNRVVGKISRHGNLILSKTPLREVANEPLPSKIKGRGMLAAAVDTPIGEMVVANVHLSLGLSDQLKQIRHIRERLKTHDHVCLMGDFNCPPEAEQLHVLTDFGYTRLGENSPTYPSWKPSQTLDHIFVKGSLNGRSRVGQFTSSDHLPIMLELDF